MSAAFDDDEDLAIPEFLKRTPERQKALAEWNRANPPKAPAFIPAPTPQPSEFAAKLEAERKTKARNRIARMLAKKEDHSGERRDPRTGMWVPAEMTTEQAMNMLSVAIKPRVYSSAHDAARGAVANVGRNTPVEIQPIDGGFTFIVKNGASTNMKPATKIAAGPTGIERQMGAKEKKLAINMAEIVKAIVMPKKAPAKPAKKGKPAKAPKAPAKAKAPTKAALRAKAGPADAEKAAGAALLKGKRAQVEADARAGKLPEPPDFSANTHKPFRKKLDALTAMVAAKDIPGLKAFEIKPASSSPKALDRYRNLAVLALEAAAA